MPSIRFSFIFSNPNPLNPHAHSPNSPPRLLPPEPPPRSYVSSNDRHRLFLQNALNLLLSSENSLPLWGSLSLADNGVPVVDSKTGSSFPLILEASQKLCGIWVRRKCVLGLKNIDVYAFGVYADDDEIKKCISDKYGKFSASELKGSKEFTEDLLENDIHTIVRLQIVYGKLSIRSVRSAFEESVGSKLMKYGRPDNKELLQRSAHMIVMKAAREGGALLSYDPNVRLPFVVAVEAMKNQKYLA